LWATNVSFTDHKRHVPSDPGGHHIAQMPVQVSPK
jgi:hypothetical protein